MGLIYQPSDVLNVKDFGVVGDGVTDDKANFKLAIDAAILLGKPLYLPSGIYNVGRIDYDPPTADAVLRMVGENPETTIIIGDISSNGFLDIPEECTGEYHFENIYFKDFYRCFDFAAFWLAGPASTIKKFTIHNCKFTQVATTGVRSIIFIPSPLRRNHAIDKIHITDSYFEFGSDDASAHIVQMSGCAINDMKIEDNEFVGGQRQVNWMPDEPAGENFDVAFYNKSAKIRNNLFRDVSSVAVNTSMIRIAGLNIDISGNTFRNFVSNSVSSCGVIYAQAVGEIHHNSFEDCYCTLGAIYSKGTPKFFQAKISTVARTSNVATVVTVKEHGLSTTDTIDVVGCETPDFNGSNVEVTVIDSRTFTYSNVGADVSATKEPLGYAYNGGDRSGYDLDVSFNRFTHTAQTEWSSGIWLARCSHAVRFNTFDGWYSNGNDGGIRIDSTGDGNYDILIEGNRWRGCHTANYINVLSVVTEALQIKNNTVSDSFNGGAFCRLVGVGTYDGFAMKDNTIIQNNPDEDVQSMLDVIPLSSGTITLNRSVLSGNKFLGENVSECRMFILRATTNLVDPIITENWGPDRTDRFLLEVGTVNWSGVEIIKDNYTRKNYTTSNLPDPSREGQVIYVSDGAAGSPIMAFSDGTNWLRFDTATAVSSS